ncbi:MAG: hypothetical protein M3R17_00575, partial [Bacteroidota bacterium]|nr:hypothetical protein [Bacteroidota bacterium]
SYSGYQLTIWPGSSSGKWQLGLYIGSGSNWLWCKSHDFTLVNEWMQVGCKFDGSKVRVYVNGRNVTSTSGGSGTFVKNTRSDLTIGSGNSSTSDGWYFNGMIADMMLFDYGFAKGEMWDFYASYSSSVNASYWNFAPFRRINAESLYHLLRGDVWQESFFQPADYYSASQQMAVYEYDPFDPDAIARLRINSWQKATFMRYIDNLLGWGDALFTQDTWETLSEATMRYVMATTLLGRIPVKNVTEEPQPVVTYAEIEAEYGAGNVPQFLIEMENQLSGPGPDATLPQQVQSIIDAYFCIPPNKQLLHYWETAADRLFKLRHGLTITGTQNDIPLFAAPLNPGALAAAAASGDTGNASSSTIPPVPWFRFSYLIAQAKSVTSEVTRLGGELLGALEKKDAEHLTLLQAGYQVVVYNLVAHIKASQVNQLQYVSEGLQASLDNATYVEDTYRTWIEESLNASEEAAMKDMTIAFVLQDIGTGIRGLAAPLYLLPSIFGLADGGMNFGQSVDSAGGYVDGLGQLMNAGGQMAMQTAQYLRRTEEWDLQMNIAAHQVKEITAQLKANDFALQAAMQEMDLNQTQLQQAQEVVDFMRTKFTNEQLYNWMAGRISSLYFQLFQLGWSLAQSAQTAFQYELNSGQTFLSKAAWNSSYQGLLAGDSLSLALQQMDSAYIAGNNRKLSIRKTWSMRQNDPQALLSLVQTGTCNFGWTELLYDLDFPGQYNRKIKTLSVTIPAVVGPYQNIHATLVQTGNTVLMKPTLSGVQYLLGMTHTAPTDGSLRVNWNPNQEIVISTGVNDSGMFQVNFNDEQYLPFEGTGAVSSWQLNVPQASNGFPLRSISDVIVTIEYTAEDGGTAFAQSVTALTPLQTYNGYQYLSLRQLYSNAWFAFCSQPSNGVFTLPISLSNQMYPANIRNGEIDLGNAQGKAVLVPAVAQGITTVQLPEFTLVNTGVASGAWSSQTGLVAIGNATVPVNLDAISGLQLRAQDFPEGSPLLTVEGKIDETKLLDLVLVMPFGGSLEW